MADCLTALPEELFYIINFDPFKNHIKFIYKPFLLSIFSVYNFINLVTGLNEMILLENLI